MPQFFFFRFDSPSKHFLFKVRDYFNSCYIGFPLSLSLCFNVSFVHPFLSGLHFFKFKTNLFLIPLSLLSIPKLFSLQNPTLQPLW